MKVKMKNCMKALIKIYKKANKQLKTKMKVNKVQKKTNK